MKPLEPEEILDYVRKQNSHWYETIGKSETLAQLDLYYQQKYTAMFEEAIEDYEGRYGNVNNPAKNGNKERDKFRFQAKANWERLVANPKFKGGKDEQVSPRR